MRIPLIVSVVWVALGSVVCGAPNVVFIAIDDQNDWVGPLGGHPLARTPNLDRLAGRGTTFLNAHCQAPLCNPSRTSLLLSLRPSTTGIYGLAPSFRSLKEYEQRVTLPQHFRAHGYRTLAAGKVFHGDAGGMRRARCNAHRQHSRAQRCSYGKYGLAISALGPTNPRPRAPS